MLFCCPDFKVRYSLKRTDAPNFRIVQYAPRAFNYSERFLSKDQLQKMGLFRFFITMGYERFSYELTAINMAYCPHCGTDLFRFYVHDVEPNEVEGETF